MVASGGNLGKYQAQFLKNKVVVDYPDFDLTRSQKINSKVKLLQSFNAQYRIGFSSKKLNNKMGIDDLYLQYIQTNSKEDFLQWLKRQF
jgi:hypothetical protein